MPGAALAVSGAAVVAGTLALLAVLPREERGAAGSDEAPRDLLGALRSPGLRTLIGAMLPVGVALGALEVALPAFADHEGRRELAASCSPCGRWAAPPVASRMAPGRAGARSRASI